ncbi:MAG: hypothetical protein DI589_06645 [Shinella sp.]|nr:MAG: hypothetical protein DI589_06645 [Shinella sp.]
MRADMPKPPKIQTGKKAVRATFLDALQVLDEKREFFDPEPNSVRAGIKPGQWDGAPWANMPPDCPITVLGKKGSTVYIIDAMGELQAIDGRWDHPTIMRLFTPFVNFPMWAWPGFGDGGKDKDGNPLPPKVKRLERDRAATALIAEAGRKGMFDPQQNVRGRGGWKAAADWFIWHSGKYLFTVKTKTDAQNRAIGWDLQAMKPGEHGGYFYAQDADTIQPWKEHVDVNESPAHQLLQDLRSWNWERPYIDPIFLLGWIGSAILSGALDVRPILFTMGGAGVGKSTLHGIIQALFGSALYTTANTTAAGIYQNIKQDSRPVAVDEFERKANSSKETTIIELARQSYSGAKGYRGGANGEGTEFELRSSFLFSAILPPVLGVQDRTRMIILNLKALDKSRATAQPHIPDVAGRMILRQLMDGYHDFHWHILPKWREILADKRLGFDSRAIDTYGTVLACAELLVGEQGMIDAGIPEDALLPGAIDIDQLIEILGFATASERTEQVPHWQQVIEKIMDATIDCYIAGERPSVGRVIQELEDPSRAPEIIDLRLVRQRLAMTGLGLRDKGKPGKGYCLAIPKRDDKLNRIFTDSDFHNGGWSMALRQAPETVVLQNLERKWTNVDINRLTKDCILVDLAGYDDWTGRADMEA